MKTVGKGTVHDNQCQPQNRYTGLLWPLVNEDLIHNLFSVKKVFGRDNHQRRKCMCACSVDLGMYDTCRAGCIYCYANLNGKKSEEQPENTFEHQPVADWQA